MKKLFSLIAFCLLVLGAQAQQSQNMSLLDTWRHPDPNRFYNDCWGYAANGREYAIIGSSWGTHFFDVTNPTNITEVASFIGNATGVIWRDYKTYGHYAYGVADGSTNSLQIFDLSGLPNTITKVYDSPALSTSAHTCFIDNGKLYLNINNRPGHGMAAVDIFSLADPVNPTYLNTISSPLFDATHAAYIRNDTAYLSNEFDGLFIYNVADPMNPQLISSITSYPGQGYNHSSWTTADAKTLVFADEVPSGLPMKVYDISDIQNPVYKSSFKSSLGTGPGTSNPGSTPHNPYVLGNNVIISYYKDGVQVYDISDPANPVRTGFYDTYPDNGNNFGGDPYEGCWGVYPFLPSGNIIASDITYGLFVLSPPYGVNSAESDLADAQIAVYPNPATNQFSVRLPEAAREYRIGLYNLLGQQVQTGTGVLSGNVASFQTANLASGLYTVQITTDGKTYSRKLTVQ